ncbi:DNA polymerase Y family protein [Asanoa ferruginea]|uniref:DNA polymerase Y family protein n=1 Tax=Asanoa ferruginea TaxID=53367 RepID=UPI001EF1C8A8|nr:DNA polymerase Y family protein [Asanoa ferruginea]
MAGRAGQEGAVARTAVLWCPDWPVIAAEIVDGVPATGAVAVMHANRVVAASESARVDGVRRGLRKREAQSRCPGLVVVDHDPARDARAFEPVVAAVEEMVAGVEVVRPGVCGFAARGPARYFGGEEAAAERIVEHVAQSCAVESQVGVADGGFAAALAAREGVIVPSGQTVAFLARRPVEALARPQLTELLRRLGISTLGAFAGLARGDVLARFGFDAALAHRLASGGDERPLAVRRPPPDLEVSEDYGDDPLERVDTAAFAARMLAERLHERLAGYGLACTRLSIGAVTAHGQELHRVWRHDGLLTTAAIADRVRWQLDGWLSGTTRPGARTAPAKPTAGIIRLRLVPEGVLPHAGLQPGLWGETGEEKERAHRAFNRIQGILGPESVVTAVLGGGRSPADQVRLVPWGDELTPTRPTAPWPGRMPAPAPALVLPAPLAATVRDAAGEPVGVSARLLVTAAPARLTIGTGQPVEIVGWTGPWPVDERWWAPAEARRRARFQVALADGSAFLLSLAAGQWSVEAIYD